MILFSSWCFLFDFNGSSFDRIDSLSLRSQWGWKSINKTLRKKSKLWYGVKMMRLSWILYKRFMLRVCMAFIATALPSKGSWYISYNNITQSKNFLKPVEALEIFWFQVIFCWCGIWSNASGSVLYFFLQFFFWYFLHRVKYRINKQI